MANEDVLGPRKTMFVLVIVVGCFAVLWPRILSPLILGTTRDQLKPNQFDRETGCCEVMFEAEVAALELVNEVCNSALHIDGKLSPYAAAACRKTVNETCGLDIAAFLKRSDNVGKTTKMLLQTMKESNSSCLKEHFGVPVWSVSHHPGLKSWDKEDLVKQERPPIRGMGPHPAMRERGRAIPAGAPTPPSRGPVPLPPHIRVRSSPLSGYFELDIQPPPIPGMRPPLGSPGGPAPTPKTSMGFVMPIYTICIIVFFVYTLSKIIFKRTGTVPYETLTPDPQFRRRVFRDDSQTSPDKLVVSAISGLVAEVQQQMEASYALSQQRQNGQDNARPFTNGTVIHNTGPVHIVASEYREASKEASPETKEPSVERIETSIEKDIKESKEASPEPVEDIPESKEVSPEPVEEILESREASPASEGASPVSKESSLDYKEESPEPKELSPESIDASPDRVLENLKGNDHKRPNGNLVNLDDEIESDAARLAEEFLQEELRIEASNMEKEKQSTPELLEEALIEETGDEDDQENASVKVVGMETTAHSADGSAWPRDRPPPLTPLPPARPPGYHQGGPMARKPGSEHEAEEVQEIFLSREIPQQTRVLVAGCGGEATQAHPPRHSPAVVSGKMTLSLIQDDPRETPERELESTMDEFTTASGVTQNAAEKEDDLSDEEIDEEIEIEEIEEEVEEEEEDGEETEERPTGVDKK